MGSYIYTGRHFTYFFPNLFFFLPNCTGLFRSVLNGKWGGFLISFFVSGEWCFTFVVSVMSTVDCMGWDFPSIERIGQRLSFILLRWYFAFWVWSQHHVTGKNFTWRWCAIIYLRIVHQAQFGTGVCLCSPILHLSLVLWWCFPPAFIYRYNQASAGRCSLCVFRKLVEHWHYCAPCNVWCDSPMKLPGPELFFMVIF